MNKLLLLACLTVVFCVQAYGQTPFTLVSSEKKTVKETDIAALEKVQTTGGKDKTTLTFTEKEVRLVVLTGPEDDMLSFRIQGIRNPVLVVPAGARLTILFVNADVDMRHDIRFGYVLPEFPLAPELAETAGSGKLGQRGDDGTLQAEELVVTTGGKGLFKYFCSVRGHARGGMWGHIAVGVKPTGLKQPSKTKHIHNEDEADDLKAGKKPADKTAGETADETMGHDMGQHDGAVPQGHFEAMRSVTNIGDRMEREASGTAWAPDSSPVYAKTKMYGDGGMLMLMGTGFVRYTRVGSTRDVSSAGRGSRSRADAPMMFMAMYSRPVGKKAQIGFRAMMSPDPVIQKGWGYPLLYQSGELYKGQPLHDRQHPHDLFSELAVTWSYKLDDKRSVYLYAGLPGEPALGPPMYLHRASGANNPDAPIGHHWQDATHITFGVVTAGFSFGKAKIEASAFNGREPDENRWTFDRPRLNSYSARLSLNPTRNLSLQISHGFLRNPEPAEPTIRILRKTTASVIFNKKFDEQRNWASTFVWGQNYANGERSSAFLFESNYDFYKNAVFGRLETVKKSGHDLVLDHPLDHGQFWVSALSLGYVRDIVQGRGLDVGIGGTMTLNRNPSSLAGVYGGTTHGGWQVFMRFRPSKTK